MHYDKCKTEWGPRGRDGARGEEESELENIKSETEQAFSWVDFLLTLESFPQTLAQLPAMFL